MSDSEKLVKMPLDDVKDTNNLYTAAVEDDVFYYPSRLRIGDV